MNWIVLEQESGLSLRQFLKKKTGHLFSSKTINLYIEQNHCKVNDRVERFGAVKLGTGDHVSFREQYLPLREPTAFETLRVLYEDEFLLAYEKPPGIASDEQGMLQLLRKHDARVRGVHRLDKNTSGVLLFAKTEEAQELIENLFRDRKIVKTYLAIVDGNPKEDLGKIEKRIGMLNKKCAETQWECLKRGKTASLLQCFPKTGRTHQIRIHLASIGHPIIGDHEYGKHFFCPYHPKRILLHASKIQFTHPLTKQCITIQSEIPEDMQTAIEELFF